MSVTDGSLTTDGAQQTVRIAGTVTTTSSGSGGTVTQGTPGTTGNAWPVKITDGTNTAGVDPTLLAARVLVTNTTNIPVQVSGTTSISGTVNQGTNGSNANAWITKISNGNSTADLAPAAASGQGNALLVTTGIISAPATLSAQSAVANGTTVDFGAAKQCITLVVTAGAGVSAGVVTLQLSQDNTNFYSHTTTITTSAPGVSSVSITGVAFRYARGSITTTVTGGTVSATIQGT